jgi:hypothetical protein
LKLTVTPDGWPLALNATDCAEPLVTAVEIVDVPLEPCATERLDGFALMEKSAGGGGVTVSVTVVECVPLGAVPVTVTVYVPVAVEGSTLIVIVDEPPAVTDDGLKLAVAPVGSPVALSATDCAEPLVTAVEIVEVPLEPWPTLTLEGFALIEKSDGPVVQLANLNDPMRVCQLKLPLLVRYWSVYQNVQSSLGSTLMLV